MENLKEQIDTLKEYKEKISKLSTDEKKDRDIYLRELSDGTLQGPPTGYSSIDKTWLKYYDKDKYILGSTNWSDDGGEGSNEEVEFNNFDELFNELYNIDFDQCNIDLDDEHRPEESEVSDNPFDQTFESFDIYGNKLTEAKEEEPKVCCICGEEYEGYGNNAEPYKTGYCCDACNLKFVIPARMQAMNSDKEDKEDKED